MPEDRSPALASAPESLARGSFSPAVLKLDTAAEVTRICATIREQVLDVLRRRGAVVGVSGGVDSAVVAALCARALGPQRVVALLMPETHSSGDAVRLGRAAATACGLRPELADITAVLNGARCYELQHEAIRSVVPDYGAGWKCKLVLPSVLEGRRLQITQLVVQSPDGQVRTVRLAAAAYLQLVAATNFKQRVRKMIEYYHADRLNFAVAGTPNRLEYDQGFFVKQGDGAADFKPIAHLYKTQVYDLARELEVPLEIRERPPTTDTFSMPQTQEEFYFTLPYEKMDLCLYGYNHHVAASEVAVCIDLETIHVERIYKEIAAKRRATAYLHTPPLFVDPVAEV